MVSAFLSGHEGLVGARRFGFGADAPGSVTVREWAALAGLGFVAAALSAWVKSGWGIPGHNILMVIFPMAMGLAIAPRHGSATVVGASGLAFGGVFLSLGARGLGAGALAGLGLLGLLLDLALLGAKSGRGVYFRLAAAGLAANLAALGVRAGAKLVLPNAKPWEDWWPLALVTYPLCGLIAGLISAAVWFRATAGAKHE